MKVTTYGTVETEQRSPYPAQASLALIDVTEGEAERGICGEHVATVNVNRPDGRTARFFVTVHVDSNGRAWGEITANLRNGETRRKAAGVWLDYTERAEGGAE